MWVSVTVNVNGNVSFFFFTVIRDNLPLSDSHLIISLGVSEIVFRGGGRLFPFPLTSPR